MRLSSFLAVFRPALPLILGLSLGCSLSLLMVSWTQGETDEACGDDLGNGRLVHNGHSRDLQDGQEGNTNEDFQPRIVPSVLLSQLNSSPLCEVADTFSTS